MKWFLSIKLFYNEPFKNKANLRLLETRDRVTLVLEGNDHIVLYTFFTITYKI